MTTEEKAKAYDIALDKLKRLFGTGGNCTREEAEYIFPELAESEDERIRKELVGLITWSTSYSASGITHEEADKMLAWLEKQGEQNTIVVIPKFRVGDVIRPIGSMAEYTIESISGECYYGKGWGLHISCDNDYELVEQKPAEWSEDDKKMSRFIGNAITADDASIYLESKGIQVIDAHVWLEKLKDRVIPQPKNEWSEEDERLRTSCIKHIEEELERIRNDKYGHSEIISDLKESCRERINWLKSLSPQSHWRPSEEQMVAIQEAMNIVGVLTITGSKINSLYQDLKKLREQR